MSKSKVNPEEILKDIDEVFKTIKNWEEDKISINEFENWASLLKQYYYVDTILRANGQLWMCNQKQIKN